MVEQTDNLIVNDKAQFVRRKGREEGRKEKHLRKKRFLIITSCVHHGKGIEW